MLTVKFRAGWLTALARAKQSVRILRFEARTNLFARSMEVYQVDIEGILEVIKSAFYQDRVGPLIVGANPLDDHKLVGHYAPAEEVLLVF